MGAAPRRAKGNGRGVSDEHNTHIGASRCLSGRELAQLRDEDDHVGARLVVAARARFDVEVDAVGAVVVRPLGHLRRHRRRRVRALEERPRVGMHRVGVAADGEDELGLSGQRTGGRRAARVRQLLERRRHRHVRRVDEGEEDDVGALLLVRVERRLPDVLVRVVGHRVVGDEAVLCTREAKG
eukprot:2219347-Prymnesium_polylepis.1